MSKRRADKYLTHDNFDQEEDEEEVIYWQILLFTAVQFTRILPTSQTLYDLR
jgi:NUP50 (Nucleoporin 50 kDa)